LRGHVVWELRPRRYWTRCPLRGQGVICAILLLTTLWCGARSLQGQDRTPTGHSCLRTETEPLRVSEDSIGPWWLGASLATLRAKCPGAHDTLVVERGTASTAFPALVFPLGDLTAVAMQYRDSILRPQSPADAWVVTGSSGTLPRHVPLNASWGDLQGKYGRATLHARGFVVARFCDLPRMLFTIAFEATTQEVPLLVIPRGAKIHHVVILSPDVANMMEKC